MVELREIVLDTETTGLNPLDGHRIIEIGCVELINKVPSGKVYHAYINPKRNIPEDSFRVHGISAEFLADKPLFAEIANDFLTFIKNSHLVIHNAGFDISFINNELKQIGLNIITFERVIDTLTIARRKFPRAPASLDALCQRFNISLENREKHGALIDSQLLAKVYIALLEGSQSSFSLDNKKNQAAYNAIKPVEFPNRVFPLSEEEIDEHKKFVFEKITKPIWES
jgi:DNA polymerase-3 subunit epsilon